MRIAYNNLLSILLLSGLVCPLSLFGQDSLNVRKIGEVNLWTSPVGVECLDGDLLAVATSNTTGIVLMDNSNPQEPQELGQFPIWNVSTQIKCHDNRIFFAGSEYITNDRMYAVDVSDPANPTFIDYVDRSGDRFDIWGDILFMTRYPNAALSAYDLLNDDPFTIIPTLSMIGVSFVAGCLNHVAIARSPFNTIGIYSASPNSGFTLIDTFSLPENPIDIQSIGDYELALCRDGLQLFSVTDSNITLHWFFSFPGNCRSMRLEGDRAYVRFNYPSGFTHISILDLSDPLSPDSIGNFRAYGATALFDVHNNIVYVPQLYPGYAVFEYDVTSPDSAIEINRIQSPGPGLNFAMLDSLLYVGGTGGPSGIWSIADPLHPLLVGRAFDPGGSYETCIANGRGYVASDDDYWVYDMSSPLAPIFLGRGEPDGWPECAAPGVVGCTDGIYGENQFGQNRYRELDNVKNLEVYDSIMVVSANGINILENVEWQTIGYTPTPSWDVRKRGGIIYSASNTAGLKVIDATDLSNPVLINSIPIEGETRQLELQDNILMTCSRAGGVRFWDVSIPESPQLIGMYESGNSAEDVVLIDTVAYVADYYKLTVLDVSDALALAGPPRPQGLAIVAVSDSLYLSWRQARNATSYRLWCSVDAALPEELYTLAVSTSDTVAVLPLDGESSRFFFVTAIRE
ncbi:hypothetical protein HUU59_07490 [bacterium]|nr:hypothetical protein [bacterium]